MFAKQWIGIRGGSYMEIDNYYLFAILFNETIIIQLSTQSL